MPDGRCGYTIRQLLIFRRSTIHEPSLESIKRRRKHGINFRQCTIRIPQSCGVALNIYSAIKLTFLIEAILPEALVESISAGKAVAIKALLSKYS